MEETSFCSSQLGQSCNFSFWFLVLLLLLALAVFSHRHIMCWWWLEWYQQPGAEDGVSPSYLGAYVHFCDRQNMTLPLSHAIPISFYRLVKSVEGQGGKKWKVSPYYRRKSNYFSVVVILAAVCISISAPKYASSAGSCIC